MSASAGNSEPTGVRIEGGWDHEHCEICKETISLEGIREAYLDPQSTWVCPGCYEKNVEAVSLGFIPGA